MNLSTIKNLALQKGTRQLLVARKNSPTVLFAGGIVGVVATAVLASKATLHLEGELEDIVLKKAQAVGLRESENPSYSEQDFNQDMAVLYVRSAAKVAKLYMPAIVVGVASIAALTASHGMLTKRNVALTAAYAALDKGFKEYRARVVEELGEDKDREFRYETETKKISEKTESGTKTKSVKSAAPGAPSIYARFFDQTCIGSWQSVPEYNRVFLQAQQNYANDKLNAHGHVFLNEVYDMLGMERSKAGAVVGWIRGEGDSFIDFGIFDGDRPAVRDFVNGHEGAILLDFNVSGVIYDKI